jgi:transposase
MPNADPYGGFTIPEHLHLDALSFDGDSLTIHASTDNPAARCPCCQRPSRRVHGRYTRTLADLPWSGTPVHLRVRVRKFFCDEPSCERKIFAERLQEVARPFARGTDRRREALEWIAFALGGEAGARLACELGLLVSPDTLLNRIRGACPVPKPRTCGCWAWRTSPSAKATPRAPSWLTSSATRWRTSSRDTRPNP